MRKEEVRAVYRDQVIAQIRSLGPECRQSGDDSQLDDVWKEFKDQAVVFDADVETIEAFFVAAARAQLLWLDTNGYFDRVPESC